MDYGKFVFEQNKKAQSARRKQKQIQVKEIKFRPGTEEGDYQVKLRNLIKFLTHGDKTKVTLRFRGREMAHQEFGVRLLERVKIDLDPYGVVEQFPKMEGRQMIMVLSPKKVPHPVKAPAKKADDKAPEKAPRKSAAAKKDDGVVAGGEATK